MDIGTAITASTGILGAVAVVFRIFWRGSNGNGNGKTYCEDHSGLCAKQDGFADWLDKIEKKLDRVIEQRSLSRN
jgi:hypothetical protein